MRNKGNKFSEFDKKAQDIIRMVCESENYHDVTNLFYGNEQEKMETRAKCYAMARSMGYGLAATGRLFFKNHATVAWWEKKIDAHVMKKKIKKIKDTEEEKKYVYIPNYKTYTVERVLKCAR